MQCIGDQCLTETVSYRAIIRRVLGFNPGTRLKLLVLALNGSTALVGRGTARALNLAGRRPTQQKHESFPTTEWLVRLGV